MSDPDTFELDGRQITLSPGDTIMQAAVRAGVYIPHLCYRDGYSPHGSCRICMVEMDGRMVAACTTPAQPGACVKNETPENTSRRRAMIQMLFIDGEHVCPGCERSGACQLQAVAYHVGMLNPRFRHSGPHHGIDASHPDTIIDFDRCILCELCVRASHDIDHKRVFAIAGRGRDARLVINSPSGELADSEFDPNDAAAHVCPVGAILSRRHGYLTPIGERLYDRLPVSVVGDASEENGG